MTIVDCLFQAQHLAGNQPSIQTIFTRVPNLQIGNPECEAPAS